MCALLCVCPPKVESLFPPVLSKSCSQIPLAFKVWFSRNSSSRCPTPRLGSLMWGSEPWLQWVDFCGISVLQSVSHPPSSYGIWFYCGCVPPTVSFWLFLCLWMWGIVFGEFQCLPVDDCPAASCDSGVLTRGSESTSFYSAILFPIHTFVIDLGYCVVFQITWHYVINNVIASQGVCLLVYFLRPSPSRYLNTSDSCKVVTNNCLLGITFDSCKCLGMLSFHCCISLSDFVHLILHLDHDYYF